MLKAVFWDYQEDSRGAWIKCHIPNESIDERFVSKVMMVVGFQANSVKRYMP